MPYTGQNAGVRYGWAFEEDGWDVEQNEDNRTIDTLLVRAVKTIGLITPPGSPTAGDRHIVGIGANGAWSGKGNQLALYDGSSSAWVFIVPKNGWDVYVVSVGATFRYNLTFWWIASAIDATAHATVQLAIDAAATWGGTEVRLPPGTINKDTVPSNSGGITIPAHVHLVGAGKVATFYSLVGQSASIDAIKITGEKSSVRNLSIIGQGSSGSGRGILVKNVSAAFEGVVIDGCDIIDTPAWGIEFANGGAGKFVYTSLIRDCKVTGQKSTGAIRIGPECGSNRLERVNMPMTPLGGKAIVEIDGASGTLLDFCQFDAGAPGGVCLKWLTEEAAGFPMTLTVRTCWFEDHDPGTYGGAGASAAPYFIMLDSRRSGAPNTGQLLCARIEDCQFVRVETTNLPIHAVSMYSDVNPHRAIAIVRNFFLTNQTGSMPTDDVFTDSHGHKILLEDNNVRNGNNAGSSDLTHTGSGVFTVRYAW